MNPVVGSRAWEVVGDNRVETQVGLAGAAEPLNRGLGPPRRAARRWTRPKTVPRKTCDTATAHDFQFLAFSTAMGGRNAETIEAARRMRAVLPEDVLFTMPGIDWYMAEPYLAMECFGLGTTCWRSPRPTRSSSASRVAI